jgi:hypothetical protein
MENNIEMDLKQLDWKGIIWIDVAQDTDKWRAFVNA